MTKKRFYDELSAQVFDLDPSSPVPLYFQISEQLERAIVDGTLGPGDRLDNEEALALQLGVSRPTIRRGIQRLVSKGMLVRTRGVGTQIVKNHVAQSPGLGSLYDELVRSKRHPTTRVLTIETVPASEAIAQHLQVDPGSPVTHLERVRSADGETVAFMRNWLPGEISALTQEALESRSLYAVMRAAGHRMRLAHQQVGARTADTTLAKLLEIKRGAALLTLRTYTHDDSGGVLDYGSHCYRPDLYSFEITRVGV